MNREKEPKLIFWLNGIGVVIFMAGFCGLLMFPFQKVPFTFCACAVVTFFGWFLTAIRVSPNYPSKLFVFTIYDLVIPTFFSLYFLLLSSAEVMRAEKSMSEVLWWVLGFWVVMAITGVLMRIAARIGAKIARRQVAT